MRVLVSTLAALVARVVASPHEHRTHSDSLFDSFRIHTDHRSAKMKIIVFAFVALLVGANAIPSKVASAGVKNEKIIAGIITSIIESIAQQFKDLGLDPLVIKNYEGQYTFPVPGIFSGSVNVKKYELVGVSNIVINEVSFNGNTLSFDISLPSIVSNGDAFIEVQILKRKLFGGGSGRFAIKGLRFAGKITLGTEKLIEDLHLAFSLGGIESDLNINIMGYDISDRLNEYLGKTLPSQLNKYEEQLNRVLANLILKLLDRFLSRS